MKFTQQALNDSNQAIGLLSLEVSMMRKVALQDCMVLDIVTPSQGETCYNTEYWVFIPDESSNVTCLMTHMKNQISTLNDPLPSLSETLGRWFDSGGCWLKSLLMIVTPAF